MSLPTDNRDLRDPASEQVRTFDEHVVALGFGVQVSGPRDGCHQQPELLWGQRPGALAQPWRQRARWHRIAEARRSLLTDMGSDAQR